MTEPLFDTVLVANRGEIARRVIRTLRRLGIRSVAVYSDADAGAPHVREADVAVRIGPAAAAASYLDIDAVVRAAVDSGAQAVHPGYGFLSENPAFARACAAAGIVFVGPGERALDVMADKIRARDHVAAHGVPIVPGFSAAGMSGEGIVAAAVAAGFPLLVKPSAGGGGKGMQIVRAPEDVGEAVAAARRIATASFGDDTLLFERLLERPRHIEVQVLADAHGGVIHLGERECTLQRRHQKVIEEAPSPVVDETVRARLGAAACAAAASVDYRGAGTVEFLVAADRPDEFFFIEMNTRLQVEHPVTELVTGVDLVEQQLRVAAGLPLALTQDAVHLRGHAMEARVYAESPESGFLPATGEVIRWRPSAEARTDSAVETGSIVTADYDPMVAKVVAWGQDRDTAVTRLDAALADTVLAGVDGNIAFLRSLLALPEVRSGDLDTGIIDRLPRFVPPAPTETALAAAVTARRIERIADRATTRHASPLWAAASGWRMSAPAVATTHAFLTEDDEIVTVAEPPPVSAAGGAAGASISPSAAVDVSTAEDGTLWIHADGATWALRPVTRREAADIRLARRERAAGPTDAELAAPMPGAVVAVHVSDGDTVVTGDRIVTIEAMKMEHAVTAPHDGVVTLSAAIGDQVRRGQVVARIIPPPSEDTP
jgi:acetyl-CoA/propionyl-CoA carboxylase, biotin carboxylase, biotin carboxyl carrier protein